MSAVAGLGARLNVLGGALARARGDLDAGNEVDLTALEIGVKDLCAHIAGLSIADGRVLQPRLLTLMDDFGHLSAAIEARLEGLRRELGDASGRHTALRAYGKTPGPGQ
jgi:hypothetical protein